MLNQIKLLHMEDMLGFDPKDIIFITNKWDHVIMACDSSDEEEEISIWNKFKSDLRSKWAIVKEKNIFRTSLKYVIYTFTRIYIKFL